MKKFKQGNWHKVQFVSMLYVIIICDGYNWITTGQYFCYNAPLCSAVDFKCNSHHAFEISSATQRSCITVHNDSTFSHLSIKLNVFKLLKLVRKDYLFCSLFFLNSYLSSSPLGFTNPRFNLMFLSKQINWCQL